MIILKKYTEQKLKNGNIRINKLENCKCYICGSILKHRDYTKRIYRTENRQTITLEIERMICPKCKKLQRLLPDYIIPYKQYEKGVIDGVLEGYITDTTIGFDVYPHETTMNRWKKSQKIQ